MQKEKGWLFFWMSALLIFSLSHFLLSQEIVVKLTAEPQKYMGTCPAPIKFKGRIATSVPGKVRYQFVRSDGGTSPIFEENFEQAGWKEVNTTWSINGDYSGWMAIKVLFPKQVESEKALFKVICLKQGSAIPKEDKGETQEKQHVALPPGEFKDSNEPSISEEMDFSYLKLKYQEDRDLLSIYVNTFRAFSVGNFSIYFSTDFDEPAEIAISCLKDRFSVAAETSPGLFNNILLSGTPKIWSNSYSFDIPWTKIFGNRNEVIIWVYSMESRDRIPDSDFLRFNRANNSFTLFADKDKDGIGDDKEIELLNRYSPFYLFTQGEGYRPCDAIWYIRHSSLKPLADEGERDIIKRGDLNINPALLLTANELESNLGPSDITKNPRRTAYCLNPANEYRDGFEERGYVKNDGHFWSDIISLGNIGTYGHVVPWQNYYLISYWQFYGYSEDEGPFDVGDHEADWESVHLLINPENGWIVKTFHAAHGKEISFDFGVVGISRWLVNTPIGEVVEFRGPNYDISGFNIHDNPQRANNNLVRFARDPQTGEFTHLVAYIERNCHGSWPSEYWTYKVKVGGKEYSAPPHNGDFHRYLTKNIPNLGEVEYPLSENAKIILNYNGRWGAYRGHAADEAGSDTPPGPQFHWQWVWPKESYLSGLRKLIPDNYFTNGSSFFKQNRY